MVRLRFQCIICVCFVSVHREGDMIYSGDGVNISYLGQDWKGSEIRMDVE